MNITSRISFPVTELTPVEAACATSSGESSVSRQIRVELTGFQQKKTANKLTQFVHFMFSLIVFPYGIYRLIRASLRTNKTPEKTLKFTLDLDNGKQKSLRIPIITHKSPSHWSIPVQIGNQRVQLPPTAVVSLLGLPIEELVSNDRPTNNVATLARQAEKIIGRSHEMYRAKFGDYSETALQKLVASIEQAKLTWQNRINAGVRFDAEQRLVSFAHKSRIHRVRLIRRYPHQGEEEKIYLMGNTILGRGGFKKVEKAFDYRRLRPVAIATNAAQDPHRLIRKEGERLLEISGGRGVAETHDLFTFRCVRPVTGIVQDVYDEDLHDTLFTRGSSRLTSSEKQQIIGDLLVGLSAIHRRGLVHSDIKYSNILLKRSAKGKIASAHLTDFGSMVPEGERIHSCTRSFVTQETVQRGTARRDMDLFALGKVFFKIHERRQMPMNIDFYQPQDPTGRMIKKMLLAKGRPSTAERAFHRLTGHRDSNFHTARDVLKVWNRIQAA